jgi:methylated-DNA-[protein]-cysteine S-methyltransferase/AraC family transcriptional regulator of adaptative response/methylated-DNA-[protein]-cysteine methyltransferase
MNLMTSEAALRLLPAAESVSTAADVLFFGIRDSVLGKVLLARGAKGVCAILLGDDAGELEADLAGRFPEAALVANEVKVRDDLAKVVRYAEKPAEGLDLAPPQDSTRGARHAARRSTTIHPRDAC